MVPYVITLREDIIIEVINEVAINEETSILMLLTPVGYLYEL